MPPTEEGKSVGLEVHRYDCIIEKIPLPANTNAVALKTLLQISAPFPVRSVIFRADDDNTDTILLGATPSCTFPLDANEAMSPDYVDLAKFFVQLVTGTSGQFLHVVAGGL